MSPPGGDFSDPVTSATLGIVQVSVDSRFSSHSCLNTLCYGKKQTFCFFLLEVNSLFLFIYFSFCLSGVLGSG